MHISLRKMGPVLPKTHLWLPTALMINAQILTLAIIHSFPLLRAYCVPGPVLGDGGDTAGIKTDLSHGAPGN